MKMMIFDLWGKFAHFRKFYTNSSSLSYSVPPRTTIEGMIGALLGYERDSYYEILNSDNLHLAVRKVGKTKKIMQSLNYIKATGSGDLISPKSHTQIPFELIAGDKKIRYRFYVVHEDEKIMSEIIERISNNRPAYPLCFGSAPFGCYINYIDQVEYEMVKSNKHEIISTVIKNDKIKEINIEKIEGSLIKERMPRNFKENRIIKDVTTYIYEEEGKPLEVKINGEYVKLSNGENIVFL